MDTKQAKTLGLVLLAIIATGSIIFNVYETGEEITCRTNKPYGWNIIEDRGSYVKAVCPYKTKESVYADCSSEFRSTGSYQRYGCKEVIVIEDRGDIQEIPESTKGRKIWECTPRGCKPK